MSHALNQLNQKYLHARRFILLGALFALAPATAWAHPHLVRSSPASGAHLESSPNEIRLVFTEIPMIAATRVLLLSSKGDTIQLDSLRRDPKDSHIVLAAIRSTLASGSYDLLWRTVASDGHGANGRIAFTVGSTPADTVTDHRSVGSALSADETDSEPHRGKRIDQAVQIALGAPMWLARWAAFVSLFLLIGAVAFKYLILQRTSPAPRDSDVFYQIASSGAATAGMFSAIVLVIATVIKLYGETEVMRSVSLGTILTETGWGQAWLLQMIACVIAVGALAAAHRKNDFAWPVAAACALILSATPAITGHAISSDEALIAVPVDIAHVLAGSIWLGTLAIILIVGIGGAVKAPDTASVGEKIATLVNAFSPIALACGAIVVASGVATSLMHVNPISRLWRTTYGMTLVVKLALVSLLFTLGAWNWRRVRPNLGGEEGVQALRFSAKLELTASVLVLAVTAFLVALPLPD
jgi:putative copper export protein/methionine-rich copper-binding protein CopC